MAGHAVPYRRRHSCTVARPRDLNRGLTLRSTGRAGIRLRSCGHRRGPPVSLNVRPHGRRGSPRRSSILCRTRKRKLHEDSLAGTITHRGRRAVAAAVPVRFVQGEDAMEQRRAALCAIVAFPVALLLTTRSIAQPSTPRTLIGLLDASDRLEWWDAFRQKLRELGYSEGRNVGFETRLAKGELELLPAMAREMVRLKVNVIVTNGTAAALAAKQATSEIPIVMATGTDQVSLGLATSLARPAGNVTGLATLTSELMAKRFDLIYELVPKMSRLAVLWQTENSSSMVSIRDLEAVVSRSGSLFRLSESAAPMS